MTSKKLKVKSNTLLKLALGLFGLFVFVCGAQAFTTVVPSNSLVNPVYNAMYAVNNSVPQIDIYKETTGWSKATSLALPAGSQCYGLAVAPDGSKLYVSISAGSASKTSIFDLDNNGLPTGAHVDMTKPDGTAVYWSASSAPGGLAVGGDNKLFVTDQSFGMLRVFDTSTNTWLSNVTDHLAGNANLYSVAVTPGAASYKIYVSQKSLSGTIYVFNYNAGTIAYANTISTGLSYPTYLKVAGGRLFAAVNGTDGVDIKVYNTADDSLLGNVMSGISGSYGWTAFDLSSDGAWLVFKKSLTPDESSNRLYKVKVSTISSSTAAQEIQNNGATLNAIKSDGVTIDNQMRLVAVANSPDGTFAQYAISVANSPAVTGITPNSGAQGTTVAIGNLTGTNFIAGAAVKLTRSGQADIPMTVTAVSSSSISGSLTIPLAAQTGAWNVVVTNADGQVGTLPNGFTVVLPPPLSITATSLTNGTVNSPYSQTLQATGGTPPYNWSIASGSLPAGLSMDTSGVISGTPTTAQTVNFTAMVTDSDWWTASSNFPLTINPVAPVVSGITPNNGAQGASVSVSSLSGSNFAAGATVKLSKTGQADIPMTVTVVSSSYISGVITIPSAAALGAWNVTVTNPSGLSSTLNNGFTVTAAPANLTITTASLPNGTVGSAYSQTLQATGGTPPYSWTVYSGSLPTGLSLNSTGVISGTPTTAQTTYFAVTASDSAGQTASSNNISFTINPVAPVVSGITPNNGAQGASVSVSSLSGSNFTAGAAVKLSKTSQPDIPMTITVVSSSYISGVISIPSAAALGAWNVTVTNTSGLSSTLNNGFTVTSPAVSLSITTASLPNGMVNTAYSQTLQATGGTPPYTWTVSPGSLPAGLSLSTAGLISGTPATAQTANFTVTVADSAGLNAAKNFSLIINGAVITVIVNPNISRGADTAGASLIIGWQTAPANSAVDLWALTGNFTTDAAAWTKAAANFTLSQYTDANQVGNGLAKFYKIIPAGVALQNNDLTKEVIGKFDYQIKGGTMTLISLPFITASNSLISVIGNQLTPGYDPSTAGAIYADNARSWTIAWKDQASGNWLDPSFKASTLTLEADKAYWVFDPATKEVTVVGTISSTARTKSIVAGWNFIGSTFPAATPVAASGLGVCTAGYDPSTSGALYSDNARSWDIAWKDRVSGNWLDPSFKASTLQLQPGKGYWFFEPTTPFIWNYPKPY
jgi:Putative Ig domain